MALYVIKKQDLIDIGIPEDKILVSDIPTSLINDKPLIAQARQYNSIDEINDLDFINDIKSGAGFIIMCENSDGAFGGTKEDNNGVIIRLF